MVIFLLTVGLTGQSGAGKGEFARIFKSFEGVYHLDTDTTAREVVEKGKPCLEELCGYFGKTILNEDASLNRKMLAEIAFSDEEKHEKLNSITHHYIMEEIKKWLYDVEKDGARVAVIDAPLLFESGADSLCDITVGITAPYATRLKRIMKRDGIDKKSACLRLDSQPKDDFFEEKCDFILANNGSLKSFSTKANLLIGDILSKT
ncbi:MAG: dephospho-CoA kinase [Ruminococcaceae bacterium]|nr:dephospho-CoA kinase [Oscillospiraceae bacterium]